MPQSTTGPLPPLAKSSPERTWLSLLLIVHLFFVLVATMGNYAPSKLQARLLDRFAIYTRALYFDHNFTPPELSTDVVRLTTAPVYLTHATENDVDHRIETLPAGKDAADSNNWNAFQRGGHRAGERYKRFQRFARYLSEVAENEAAAGRIAQGVARTVLERQGSAPQQVRGRKHMLQPMDAWTNGDVDARNPDSAVYFRTTYAANVVLLGETLQVVKVESTQQAAAPAGKE